MTKKAYVLHHTMCPDGLTAASVMASYLEESGNIVEVHAADYLSSNFLPESNDGDIYILDFCFKQDILNHLSAKNPDHKIIVLDHHKSIMDELKGFEAPANVTLIFDLKKSGCRLAWDFCYPQMPPCSMVKYVEDRDLWLFLYPETSYFTAYLDEVSLTFSAYKAFYLEQLSNGSLVEKAVLEGKLKRDRFMASCLKIANEAYPIYIDGVKGLAVCANNEFHSDVGNLLAKASGTFGICWHVRPDSLVKCGIRSVGMNVSEIARRFGGGGHPFSSAFRGKGFMLLQLQNAFLYSKSESVLTNIKNHLKFVKILFKNWI